MVNGNTTGAGGDDAAGSKGTPRADSPAAAARAFDPFHEEFDELAISHAAKSAADFAATLLAFRESDWTLNRTSELPSAMLSEQRVLGAPGGLAAPDRYHRAPRWQLSPASVLHHLPPDARRQEVSALRELCRTRKRERDELEARRFEERILEKQRRKQQKEETKRRLEMEAEEEYRRKEREKRKQRKKGGPGTRDNSVSASYRSVAGGQADLAAMMAAATAQAAIDGQATVAQMMMQDECRGEEDHSALVMHDQLTAARMQADIVAALPDDAPLCTTCVPRAPCHLFTLQSYSCTAPLHPGGLTALDLILSGRNASASTLCVSLTSNAPQHLFFRPSPVFFVYANSTVEIGVDYVGNFAAECAALPTAEAAGAAVAAPSASPHAITVSIRVLSRDDIANGFSTVHSSLYWEYAENQEKQSAAAEKIVQATSAAASSGAVVSTAEARTAAYHSHSYSIPVRWVRGDGTQNNLAGSMPVQYALLASVARKEPPNSLGAETAAASNAFPTSSLTPTAAATGGVRFLSPSIDPLRTTLFPDVSPPTSAAEGSPSFRDAGSEPRSLVMDRPKSPPPAPLSPSQQPPAEFEQVVASLRAQMAEHQRQIAALQANSPMGAASPPVSESVTLQLPLVPSPAPSAPAPVHRARSAKAKTMLSASDMRQTLAASVDPASLTVPFAVAGSGLLVPVPLPNLEGRAEAADSHRQTRRRSRNVRADVDGIKLTTTQAADSTQIAAATVADAPMEAPSSSPADDESKAERLARRRTVHQVNARRGDRDGAASEPRPIPSSVDALMRRAEEDMRKLSSPQTTLSDVTDPVPASDPAVPALSSLSPPRSSVSAHGQLVLHHAAQTALTWLDENSAAPVTAKGIDDGGESPHAAVSASAGAAAAAATAQRPLLPSLTIVPSAGSGVGVSDPVRQSWHHHLRHPSPSIVDLPSLLLEWEAQLQLAEHRRAEQIQRLGAMRGSADHASAGDSSHCRSRLLYLRSELSALDDERATLMACELDVRVEARARGMALDAESAERAPLTAPLRSRPSSSHGASRSPLSLHRGRSSEDSSASSSVQCAYVGLRDRMMRLEVLRAQHHLILSNEISEMADTHRTRAERDERGFLRELRHAPLSPPRLTPPSAAFFLAPSALASDSARLSARLPAYLSATASLIRATPRDSAAHASLEQLYGTTPKHTGASHMPARSRPLRVTANGDQRPNNNGQGPASSNSTEASDTHSPSPHALRASSSQPRLQKHRPQPLASPVGLAFNPYQLAMQSPHRGAEAAARSSKPSPYHA